MLAVEQRLSQLPWEWRGDIQQAAQEARDEAGDVSERRTFELANVWRDQIILLTDWRMAGVSAAGPLRTVRAFTHNFVRTAWFGDEVLWLASDAAPVFRSLTQLVWTAFPAYPPV